MSEPLKGVLAMVLACTIWAFSAIFYKEISHVPPLEVLAHRTIWTLVFLVLVLLGQGRLGDIRRVLSARKTTILITAASLAISVNWLFFILAVQIDRVMESSLGYFIFPILSVLLAYGVLGERLTRIQVLSVLLATGAVVLLTLGLEGAPWISLVLALTFALYNLLKKKIDAGPVVSVTCEMIFLLPISGLWVWGVHTRGWSGFSVQAGGHWGTNLHDTAFLIASGPLTGITLILLSYAAKRLTLASLGLVQYLNPTLQFLLAVFLFGEVFTPWHAIAFAMIWSALGLYSVRAFRA